MCCIDLIFVVCTIALVPGIVEGVTVTHSEYDSDYHTVNFSLKWDPPSAPYGSIINYNIQFEERKHISDDIVQTSISHVSTCVCVSLIDTLIYVALQWVGRSSLTSTPFELDSILCTF